MGVFLYSPNPLGYVYATGSKILLFIISILPQYHKISPLLFTSKTGFKTLRNDPGFNTLSRFFISIPLILIFSRNS